LDAKADDQSWQQFAGLYRPAGADGATWSCKLDDLGQDRGSLGIIEGVLYGLENSCDLTNARAAGGGAVQFITVCDGEGQQYTDEDTIAETSTGISLSRNGDSGSWLSCDAAAVGQALMTATQLDETPRSVIVAMNDLGLIDLINSYQLDLDDDGDTDLIVQSNFVVEAGSNATQLRHFLFINTGSRYDQAGEISLNSGIISVRREGRTLEFVVQEYLESDARCCPSGQRQVQVKY